MRATINLMTVVLAAAVFFSCSKKEDYQSEPLADYMPLQVGKYITYRLDSTVFTSFNRIAELHSYQERHVVDAQFTDGMGRASYRILRFLRNVDGTGPWTQSGAYTVTPTEKTVEVIENNLRFVKLALPLKKDFSWSGNQFMPESPFAGVYTFNNDDQMDDWTYRIDSVDASMTLNGSPVNNIIKVIGIDEHNVPDTLEVTNTELQIPASLTTVYLRGNTAGPITLTVPAATARITIYNRTNWPVILGEIEVPVNGGKPYEYLNNKWTYGYVNGLGIRKDTLYGELPFATKDLLVDKYAKGIGLVSQEFVMWEFQAVSNTPNDGTTHGFGVKRVMIDHN